MTYISLFSGGEEHIIYDLLPPYFILLDGSVKILEVKVIEFHRIDEVIEWEDI